MSILKKGDTIGFVATSSGLEGRDITPAINYFKEKLGLNVKLATNLAKSYRYMAGTDQERANALLEMYKDSSIKALFTIRGAAGSTRMLDYIDFDIINKNPKPLFGLSDVTAIQNAILSQTKSPSYTGFLPIYDLKNDKIDPFLEKSLKNTLFNEETTITGGKPINIGSAEGEIIGGCLSPLLYLAGTKYMPDLTDKILLLEDTDEKTYKLDLMFNQLKQLKNFDKLKGIILGQFTDCILVDSFDGDIDICINDFIKDINIPIITDFPYGHTPKRHILPLGVKVKMNVTKNECTLSW